MYIEKLGKCAKKMRAKPTSAEEILFRYLKKQYKKTRTQFQIGYYIADFVIFSKGLVIEVDGEYHDLTVDQDRKRDRYIEDLGFMVLRIKNHQVFNEPEKCLQTIKNIKILSDKERDGLCSRLNIENNRVNLLKARMRGESYIFNNK